MCSVMLKIKVNVKKKKKDESIVSILLLPPDSTTKDGIERLIIIYKFQVSF